MAMLLAARLVGGIGIALWMTRCVFDRCRRLCDGLTRLLDRTHVRRHRDLLEQQTEEGDQRDEAAMSTALEHVCGDSAELRFSEGDRSKGPAWVAGPCVQSLR